MRLTRAFIPTLKETPAEATIISHRLMLRAGLMRQLTAGVYSFLPLGYRVIKKVVEIIREEMDAIGGQEFFFPAINPEDIWVKTGRRNVPNFILSIKERDLVLAPTHEEVVATLAHGHIQSYRDLPQIWYQIQNKFRNEPRPRSGVLRGRQFLMKDSYTLDASTEGLDTGYDLHAEAYKKIFTRSGLKFFIVGASSGAMGGTGSQEFMTESETGEDTVARCSRCGYAANLEVATSGVSGGKRDGQSKPIREVHTPDVRTIDELAKFLKTDRSLLAKSLVYKVDGKPVLILMMGNDQLNESKLSSVLRGDIAAFPPQELRTLTGADTGSIGPVGLKGFTIIADRRLQGANNLVSGANKNDYHLSNIDMERDVKVAAYHDLRIVQDGEPCPSCGQVLRVVNCIELGHIFKLGTKYSEDLGAMFLDENGNERPIVMGSYGIGVDRIVASHIEQRHDEDGIIWSKALAPYHVHLIGVNMKNGRVKEVSESLYRELLEAGVDTLFDDRMDVSPGFKFKDADLIGVPLQVIVGERNLNDQNKVEIKVRLTNERMFRPVPEAVGFVRQFLGKELETVERSYVK
ncbi:MAG TPA: proline--tRNA ligase [Rhodothermia bacterium]|nr:proline--tRNA ligase [Rhodothermia bacterium]